MSAEQAWSLLLFELSLSLLSVGGVIVLASEQHRFLVLERAWLTDQQFQASIALAGALICLLATLVPTSLLTLVVSRMTHRHSHRSGVKALRIGLAPVVVGAMLATAVILARAPTAQDQQPWLWALAAVACLFVWLSRVHLLVLLAAGAAAGIALQALLPLSPA
jgi:chromate transporter